MWFCLLLVASALCFNEKTESLSGFKMEAFELKTIITFYVLFALTFVLMVLFSILMGCVKCCSGCFGKKAYRFFRKCVIVCDVILVIFFGLANIRALYRYYDLHHVKEKTFDELPLGVQTLEDFHSIHPSWKEENAYNVLFDLDVYPQGFSNVSVQRVQDTGTCYAHAVVYILNLLQKMILYECKMLDMKELILKTHKFWHLVLHYYWREGNYAIDVLQKVLVHPSDVDYIPTKDVTVSVLKKNGPILVTRFHVGEFFLANNPEICLDDNLIETEWIGYHAMVLIGVRHDSKKNQTFFLLQNWWRRMQYVEVSSEYMRRTGAILFTAGVPQDRTPSNFGTVSSSFVESFVNMPETVQMENNLL